MRAGTSLGLRQGAVLAALAAHGGILLLLLGAWPARLPPAAEARLEIAVTEAPASIPAAAIAPADSAEASPPALADPAPASLTDAPPPVLADAAAAPLAITAAGPAVLVPPQPAISRSPPRPAASARPRQLRPAPAGEEPAPSLPALASPAAAPAAPLAPSADWLGRVSTWLQRNRRYPEPARQRGEEGAVLVRFTAERSGRVTAAEVVRSSGSALLDDATTVLLRGATLPAFDAAMPQQQQTLVVTLRYRLDGLQ